MFAGRKALLKQTSYTGTKGDFSPSFNVASVRSYDSSPSGPERVQVSFRLTWAMQPQLVQP